MVIGTHSLISENVKFSSLRIVVVDEQHRFGVIQRGRFSSKLYESLMATTQETQESNNYLQMAPYVLTISATPVLRTLALALRGNISLTQISDLPPGRVPVRTFIFKESSEGLNNIYKKEDLIITQS